MGAGSVTINMPKLPVPTVPDGFTLSGYEVMFDGMSERMAEGKTIDQAAMKLEAEFHGEFRVFADCVENGDSGEKTCEWNSRKNEWGPWEWK